MMKFQWLGIATLLGLLYLCQNIKPRTHERIPDGCLVRSSNSKGVIRVYRPYPDGTLAPLYDPDSTDPQKNWTVIEQILKQLSAEAPFRSTEIVTHPFYLLEGRWIMSLDAQGTPLPAEVLAVIEH
jgi:hypothetical protein